MKPDWTTIEQRPADRLDPDPLHVQEEERPRLVRPPYLGDVELRSPAAPRWPLLLGILIVILGVVVIVQLASAPRGAAHRDVSTRATTAFRGPEPLLGAPSRDGGEGVVVVSSTTTVDGVPLRGLATYYDTAGGHAAAGPVLRDWLGDWRGRAVSVCAGKRCIVTRLTDACACGSRNGRPTLIDLARADFARLASPSKGVVLVTVSSAIAPATDTEERQ